MAFKVLIVDDEPDLEVLIRQRFRKRIRTANSSLSLHTTAKRR